MSFNGGIISSIVHYAIYNRIDVLFLTFGYIISSMAIGIQFGQKSFDRYAKLLLLQKGLTIFLKDSPIVIKDPIVIDRRFI